MEIDPAVVRFAGQYFSFKTEGEVLVEDARTFLQRTDRRYDIIVHDTFTGGSTPEHLLSVEVLQRARALLRANGLFVLNFAGYQDGPRAEGTWAVARTLRSVFPVVRAFRDSSPSERPSTPTNIVFFASAATLDFSIPANAQFENAGCEKVLRSFKAWEILLRVPDGPVITDAWNPLARMQLASAEEHFKAMNELLPLEVWLH